LTRPASPGTAIPVTQTLPVLEGSVREGSLLIGWR